MSSTEQNHELDPLTRLAIKHGTDKWGLHFYTPLYHELFCHLRDQPIRLLEIGVGGYSRHNNAGHSLILWEAYFQRGTIVGIDIHDKTELSCGRVHVYQRFVHDQYCGIRGQRASHGQSGLFPG